MVRRPGRQPAQKHEHKRNNNARAIARNYGQQEADYSDRQSVNRNRIKQDVHVFRRVEMLEENVHVDLTARTRWIERRTRFAIYFLISPQPIISFPPYGLAIVADVCTQSLFFIGQCAT